MFNKKTKLKLPLPRNQQREFCVPCRIKNINMV